MLLLAATVASLGQLALRPSAFTLVSDLSDRDPGGHSRERWFGIIGSLRAAGYGVGAVVTGVATSVKSGPVYRGAIGACACLLLAAAVLLERAVPRSAAPPARPGPGERGRTERSGRGYRVLWADRPYLALVGLNTGFALCNVMLSIAFPPFVDHIPSMTWLVGPLLAMNTVVQAVLQTPVVRLIRPCLVLCTAPPGGGQERVRSMPVETRTRTSHGPRSSAASTVTGVPSRTSERRTGAETLEGSQLQLWTMCTRPPSGAVPVDAVTEAGRSPHVWRADGASHAASVRARSRPGTVPTYVTRPAP
ncbi:MFS transporter [Streptomyces sp. NPDC001480]|uniref:MFS transporter n=1 Tax=Streptomyces sp. NPDC001480 TaxID=3364577 RepID=UPI00368C38F6